MTVTHWFSSCGKGKLKSFEHIPSFDLKVVFIGFGEAKTMCVWLPIVRREDIRSWNEILDRWNTPSMKKRRRDMYHYVPTLAHVVLCWYVDCINIFYSHSTGRLPEGDACWDDCPMFWRRWASKTCLTVPALLLVSALPLAKNIWFHLTLKGKSYHI